MSNHSARCFNLWLNHFAGPDCHEIFCFFSTVSASQNGDRGIDSTEALDREPGVLNFWKRHDHDGCACCARSHKKFSMGCVPIHSRNISTVEHPNDIEISFDDGIRQPEGL